MSNQGPRRYLLCYDISCPKRLGRVHRRVKRAGLALQYSVFDLSLSASELKQLVADLKEIIHPGQDDIRIYGLNSDAYIYSVGVSHIPEDVLFFYN